MMNKKTERILTGWIAEHMGQVVYPSQYIVYNGEETTWETLVKYIKVTKLTTRHYYTVREVLDHLNECAGEDLYGCQWYYDLDEDGRIYTDDFAGYRVEGWV